MIPGADFEALDERDWCVDAGVGPTRFAVVGLGGYARSFVLPAIRDSAFCETTTVVSGSPGKARRVAGEFDARHASYEEFHEGVAVEEYDAVYVATPPARHLEIVESAAGFGKHVLCEKPLEADLDRAERLVAACEDAGVELMVGYRLQAAPAMRRVREAVRGGLLGEVTQVHGQFAYSILDVREPDHWRLDPALSGGGVLPDVGIYPANTSRFLLGSDPEAVRATVATRDDGDVDEHVAFQLAFPGGVTASLTASHGSHRVTRLELLGTDGRLAIEPAFGVGVHPTVTVETGDASVEVTPPPTDEIVEQCDYFAHQVATGSRIAPDGTDGLVDLATVRAAYESARTGRRVEVPAVGPSG